MQIKSLKGISYPALFEAFSLAFADYEMQLNINELKEMLKRRGFVPELSFASFEGESITSFTLNGIGLHNGIKTAYDTGTGTLKDFRGQGLASKVFLHALPYLKKQGISQYLLEVLQHNSKAISVYKKLDFEVSREFNYFIAKSSDLQLNTKTLDPNYEIKESALANTNSLLAFCDFTPAWQNSFDAISRTPNRFLKYGVYCEQKLLAYCIFEPYSGDITQIAVDKKHRRKGIASALLKHALSKNKHHSVKLINAETKCEALSAFLKANSILEAGKQFEMIKPL